MDHNLVKELGLKISDLQCKKYFYCGEQLRLLGTVSTTVQCVMDGFVCSSFQFRANVIEHLSTNFGVHSIAGMKLTKMLQLAAVNKNDHHCTSSGAPSPALKSLPSTPKKVTPTKPSTTPSMCGTVTSPQPGFEVNLKDSSNLFLVQWDAALADVDSEDKNDNSEHQAEPPADVESIQPVPFATEGCQADPVKVTLLILTGDSPSEYVWPGGVNSNQPIPWCHPDAHLVPWLVDDELTPHILCVNGVPSNYARGNCILCQSPINPDDTIDPNISMCTNCYIKEEIQRRMKRK